MCKILTLCASLISCYDLTLVACPAPSHKNTLVHHSFFSSFLLDLLLFSKVFLMDQSVRHLNWQTWGVDVWNLVTSETLVPQCSSQLYIIPATGRRTVKNKVLKQTFEGGDIMLPKHACIWNDYLPLLTKESGHARNGPECCFWFGLFCDLNVGERDSLSG